MRRSWIPAGVVFVAGVLCGACEKQPAAGPQRVTVARPGGSWEGTGSRTIGFVSDTGRFRITWEARDEQPPGSGVFRLTVNSAVSGRPIQMIADQHGEGRGTAEVADDPRPYNLMVDSTNLTWSISVEALFVVDAPEGGQPSKP